MLKMRITTYIWDTLQENGRSQRLLPLYLNHKKFHKLERIGMILILPLGN